MRASRKRRDRGSGRPVGGPGLAWSLAAVVALCGVATPATADPSSNPDPGAYTTNGPVYALARTGGRTYVGGDFTRVGRRSGSGAVLSPLDASRQSFPEVTGGEVRAVVSDRAGGWYIAGTFTSVGGESHLGIAHLTAGGVDSGFRASATDSQGQPAPVDALAYSGSGPDAGTLYVGGEFSKIGIGAGEIHQHLAALRGSDGAAISDWGPGTDCTPQPGCSAAVRALAVVQVPLTVKGVQRPVPLLFVGGDFAQIGTADNPSFQPGLAALWGIGAVDKDENPIAGSLVTAGPVAWGPFTSSDSPSVLAIQAPAAPAAATFPVYVGGSLKNASSPPKRLAAFQFRIDPPTARAAASPVEYANWAPAPDGTVRALSLAGGKLYFGGDFGHVGTAAANHLARTDPVADPMVTSGGTTVVATRVGAGADGPVRAVTVANDGTSVFAGGDMSDGAISLDTGSGAVRAWAPAPDSAPLALATDSGTGDVYMGGTFTSLGSVSRRGLAAFDSSGGLLDWSPGVTSSGAAPMVRALAATDQAVYVGGRFDQVVGPDGPHAHSNLAAIDPASGAPIDSFDPGPSSAGPRQPEVLSLASLDGSLYVGGTFDHVGGQARQNLARLDPSSGAASPDWDPGPTGNVYAILPACGAVYVGGGFDHVGGQPRNFLGALDPASGAATSWDPDPDGAVFALARSGPTVYAGGNFATIGGGLRHNAAGVGVGDGAANGFDAGGDGPVRALAVSDSTLFAGGTFRTIGGAGRSDLAGLDPGTGDATAWDPRPDGTVYSLLAGDDAVYAGGGFGGIGTTAQRGVAPFHGGAGSLPDSTSCSAPVMASGDGAASGSAGPRTAAPVSNRAPAHIGRLVVSPSRLHPSGVLTVRFTLSHAVHVRLAFERRVSRRCPKRPHRTAPCVGYLRFVGIAGRGVRGANVLRFRNRKVGRRRLPVGRYRVVLTADPPSGGGPARRGYFSVMSR